MSSSNSAFLDELRSKIDIVNLASRYLTLTKRGGNYWACCPFHTEKTPSFAVRENGQFFKCFGCGESGNIFNFVMKMENLDFWSSVEFLCKMYNIQPPTQQENEQLAAQKKERELMYNVLKHTTEFYHNNLINYPNSPQAQYLKQRKINAEMIDKFKIGVSVNFDDLPLYLKKQGFSTQDMLTSGVVGLSDDGQRLYDFYGKRVIFPIFNGFGDVVGYSGRSVEVSPDHTKYKNTNQTAIFNKSEILFGYNFVRDLKKEKLLDTIIIVEGHIDVISCHQVGLTNTIGCMGTALTQQHARKIKQLVDNVIVCLDGDSAGENATYKAIETLKSVDLNVKVVRLNKAKDPDEYINKFGKDAFVEELSNAIDCVDFILTDKAKKYDLDVNSQKTRYVEEALNYIAKFSSPTEQEIYLKMVQQMVKIPLDSLRRQLMQINSNHSKPANEEVETNEIVSNKNILDSKIMLLAAIIYKKLKNFEDFSGFFNADDELSSLYKFVAEKLKENQNFAVSSLFDQFDIKNNSTLDKVINYVFPSDEIFNVQLQDAIKQINKYQLKQEWEQVKQQMISAPTQQQQYEYLTKLQELTKRINEIK